MKFMLTIAAAAALLAYGVQGEALGRGFGAARAGVRVGPAGGVTVGARAGGVRAGPLGGVRAGGASAAVHVGPYGGVTAGARAGGVGVGPYGGVRAGGAVAGARVGPLGGVGVGVRAGGVGVGPYGGIAAGGVRVGGVGVGGYGYGTRYWSSSALGSTAGYVRGYSYPYFTRSWYNRYPSAWVAPRWRVNNYWVPPVWNNYSTWAGIAAAPVVYDYGSSVVINNDQVYYNGDAVSSAADYANQAITYADAGRQAQVAANDEFQPLGVFGLVKGDEQKAERIFQLAINKSGVVRGNYYDAITDSSQPVYGSMDARTQRVAWSVGDKKTVVLETGLGNLMKDQTTVLVHFGQDQTDEMVLVRLPEPTDGPK